MMTPAELTIARDAIRAVRESATGRGILGPAALQCAAWLERALAERAELVEPVAYRVECRWADPALDQTWSKYADYGTRKAAELSQQRFAGPGDIQSRIVPLYAGEPEEPR